MRWSALTAINQSQADNARSMGDQNGDGGNDTEKASPLRHPFQRTREESLFDDD